MISIDSNLFQNHPNWMISLPNRNPSPGRNQFILDFSKQEVQHYIINSISDLLSSSNIAYCKWDMNRNFSDLFSSNLKNSNQSELLHRYVLGLYSVLEQLHQEFPNVLFESCSSGGNRFDLGMLYYMPQTWTSDNSDAIERLNIQYGTSMLYPLSTMGAHVSASPNHQVLRTTPIETRFNVSAFGLLGYELDLSKLKRFEKAAIKNQIIFYKEHRNLLQFGTFYRIKNPFEENVCIWMVVNRDQTEALLGYYQKLAKPNPGYEKLPVVGVDSSKKYQVTNRVQYMNIHQIGDLVSQALPIRINSKGVIFTILANNYLFKQENLNQTYMGSLLLNDGITPFHQFTGTGYNDFVRIIGDFGSRIYYIKENIHEQRV
jgi:alpha-galactosidase